jgi:hypothetical protein
MCSLLAAACLLAAGASAAATIMSVSPRGEVAQVRQLSVKFSEAVVPFQDAGMRRLPPPTDAASPRFGMIPTFGAGAAVRQIDLLAYSDGVSYWDKQDQIHQATHNHGGNSFIPWHRELCNQFEKLLQQVDPDVALHYWDWTQDPRAADNGTGGTANLCEDTTMGTANGIVEGVLERSTTATSRRSREMRRSVDPASHSPRLPAWRSSVASDATTF